MSDEELIELVAKKMWDWCHDGSWEDVEYCVSQETRNIYLTDARIALETIRSITEALPDGSKPLENSIDLK